MNLKNFFELYMRRDEDDQLKSSGVEFRYASAALLIACSKADLDESEEEKALIQNLLTETFGVSEATIDKLFDFAYFSGEGDYLDEILKLINDKFTDTDKQFVLENLWKVAYADDLIEAGEEAFIRSVAENFSLTEADIEAARVKALP